MNEVGSARTRRPCSPARLPTPIDRRERPRHDWRLLDAGLRICPSFEPRYAVASIYSHMSYYLLINSLVIHENNKHGCRLTGPGIASCAETGRGWWRDKVGKDW